jgi:hypothetical protein
MTTIAIGAVLSSKMTFPGEQSLTPRLRDALLGTNDPSVKDGKLHTKELVVLAKANVSMEKGFLSPDHPVASMSSLQQ